MLMPTFLRDISIKMLFVPFALELSKVKAEFDTFRNNNLYILGITPQVCRIEKLLNDRYDSEMRRIFLTDGVLRNLVATFTDAEAKPIYLGTSYLYSDAEFGYSDNISFVVNVPSVIALSLDAEIAEIINSYKLPGKRFKIERYA